MPAAGFPSTGILDDCNRANEDPLSQGGLWVEFTNAFGNLVLVSNHIESNTTAQHVAFYRPAQYGNQEMYITISTTGTGNISLYTCLSGQTVPLDFAQQLNAYRLQITLGSGAWQLDKIRNAISVGTLASGTFAGGAILSGDKIGLRSYGGFQSVQLNRAATNYWQTIRSVAEAGWVYGALGLSVQESGVAGTIELDDVGGGAVVDSDVTRALALSSTGTSW